MDLEEDSLGGSFGLGRVLASSGIDPSAFSSFFSKTSANGAGPSTTAYDDVDVESDHAAYEDDISDSELPVESAEEIRARELRKAEEERWVRRAQALQAQAESEKAKAAREKRKKEREKDDAARVKALWPEFERGKRIKMSEVFYETPSMRKGWRVELGRKKRRKADNIECELADRTPNLLS